MTEGAVGLAYNYWDTWRKISHKGEVESGEWESGAHRPCGPDGEVIVISSGFVF